METKELKIQAPKGYEIDKENSTFECIRFKPIKKDITYEDMCNVVFVYGTYFTNERGYIYKDITRDGEIVTDKNIASNEKQLRRVLALNQLLNIAEYYNKLHPTRYIRPYCITFEEEYGYIVRQYDIADCLYGVVALFNSNDDAQAVIDNPNFRKILDTIYKG